MDTQPITLTRNEWALTPSHHRCYIDGKPYLWLEQEQAWVPVTLTKEASADD